MANVGVIGAGTWGTALSFLLHENGHQVTVSGLFLRRDAENLRREHRLKTLPDLVVLPEDMEFTSDLELAMKDKDILVTAVPSIYTRRDRAEDETFFKRREGQLVVNVAKGIERVNPYDPDGHSGRRTSGG